MPEPRQSQTRTVRSPQRTSRLSVWVALAAMSIEVFLIVQPLRLLGIELLLNYAILMMLLAVVLSVVAVFLAASAASRMRAEHGRRRVVLLGLGVGAVTIGLIWLLATDWAPLFAVLVAVFLATVAGWRRARYYAGGGQVVFGYGIALLTIVFCVLSLAATGGLVNPALKPFLAWRVEVPRPGFSEAAVTSTIRTLNTAMICYSGTYERGFPDTLSKLGPRGSGQPDADNSDLVDAVMAGRGEGGTPHSFLKDHYRFTYTPAPPDSAGKITAYTIQARPLEYARYGVRSFFSDESGVTRATAEDRAATRQDNQL